MLADACSLGGTELTALDPSRTDGLQRRGRRGHHGLDVSAADTWTIIGGTTAFVGLLIGVQGYWISRVLDLFRSDLIALGKDVTDLRGDVTRQGTDLTTLGSDLTTLRSDVTTFSSDLTTFKNEMTTFRNEVGSRLDRIDSRLDTIEHGYGERIARLETAAGGAPPGRPRSAG
jgi:hypothetical protein